MGGFTLIAGATWLNAPIAKKKRKFSWRKKRKPLPRKSPRIRNPKIKNKTRRCRTTRLSHLNQGGEAPPMKRTGWITQQTASEVRGELPAFHDLEGQPNVP